MNRSVTHLLTRGVPMTLWLVVIYAVLVFADQLISGGTFVERTLFDIPTLSQTPLVVTGGWIIVVLAFVALLIENIRSTRIRDNTANDYLSVLTLIVSLVLLIAVRQFSTMVFATVFLATLIDVLQDRIIGQAVARRDYGVQVAPPGS
jgi:hypothetical protein